MKLYVWIGCLLFSALAHADEGVANGFCARIVSVSQIVRDSVKTLVPSEKISKWVTKSIHNDLDRDRAERDQIVSNINKVMRNFWEINDPETTLMGTISPAYFGEKFLSGHPKSLYLHFSFRQFNPTDFKNDSLTFFSNPSVQYLFVEYAFLLDQDGRNWINNEFNKNLYADQDTIPNTDSGYELNAIKCSCFLAPGIQSVTRHDAGSGIQIQKYDCRGEFYKE